MKNKEGIKKKIRKIVVSGIASLKGKEKKIIGEEEIKSILFQGDSKRFLDRVIITPEKIIGEITIREEHCKDHEINGQPIFRAVDYPEMAAQLLGIWVAQQITQHPVLDGKIAPFRKASFMSIAPCLPGDLLRMEIPFIERDEEEEEDGSPRIEKVGREDRPSRERYQAIGLNAEAWVGNTKRAIIYFVELSIRDAQSLAK